VADHLPQLEAEAIAIIREAVACFDRPALLFSGGKDSIVMTHLAVKAFYPGRLPFPLLHIDTGHNFPETLVFRDRLASVLGADLIVKSVQDCIDRGVATEDPGPEPSRNRAQIPALLEAIAELKLSAVFGGARRDEERARAKERVFSVRDAFGQWDPRAQRPELWSAYNTVLRKGQHMRVFPLSNWTELDVWRYIQCEQIDLPSLYFAHERPVVRREGRIVPICEVCPPRVGESPATATVRFRTVGDATCTAAFDSSATTVDQIIAEISASRVSERGARLDDKTSDAAMEDRKREGYF
jgi:sulfate adenylyltransferase subunit 2